MYEAKKGDTFEIVARKTYGDESKAALIASANPGLTEPFPDGLLIVTPGADQADSPHVGGESQNENETAILIDGKRFRFWTDININLSIDKIDTASFTAPFEADSFEFRETFRPFSYKQLDVTVGGNPLFTGTLLQVSPSVTATGKTVTVEGYSLPGVLSDCHSPASNYPLEFNGQKLNRIAESLCAPFGISVTFEGDSGPVFERVAAGASERVLEFLTRLARQRGFITTNTATGGLIFQKADDSGPPVAVLAQGESPLLSISANFSPQEYYSDVTGITPATSYYSGGKYTIKNKFLAGNLRPYTFRIDDAESGDAATATAAKIGRMFGNMASYSIELPTWNKPGGGLWEPNQIISLTAPDTMIYSQTSLLIRQVSLSRAPDSETATLDLVPVGSFSGETPESLPWDE